MDRGEREVELDPPDLPTKLIVPDDMPMMWLPAQWSAPLRQGEEQRRRGGVGDTPGLLTPPPIVGGQMEQVILLLGQLALILAVVCV
jgi:hypothetical protein